MQLILGWHGANDVWQRFRVGLVACYLIEPKRFVANTTEWHYHFIWNRRVFTATMSKGKPCIELVVCAKTRRDEGLDMSTPGWKSACSNSELACHEFAGDHSLWTIYSSGNNNADAFAAAAVKHSECDDMLLLRLPLQILGCSNITLGGYLHPDRWMQLIDWLTDCNNVS